MQHAVRDDKFEIRNAKFETNSNDQNPKFKTWLPEAVKRSFWGVLVIWISDFEFVSCFGFGISNFSCALPGFF